MKYIYVVFPIPVYREFIYCTRDGIGVGSRVRAPFGKSFRTGYVTRVSDIPPDAGYGIKEIREVIDREPVLSRGLMELAYSMSSYYVMTPGEALGAILPPALRPAKRKTGTLPAAEGKEEGFVLSAQQEKVIKPILEKARSGEAGRYLLHGVTDSGKTEIYINVITEMIKAGRQVIILVPEIAITTQLINVLRKRFEPDTIGVWHSRISNTRKMTSIESMTAGRIKVLIGPRSAVFAPFPKLGAVIIDEEQDSSYKQGSSPYYDARHVAEERCRIEKAILILGTATPGIETMYRCENKEIDYLRITERIHQQDFPRLEIVDMRKEYAGGMRGAIFSKHLIDEMTGTLESSRQIMLFLNRRGYSPSIICGACSEAMKCQDCGITLIYHSNVKKALCHICGKKYDISAECPSCSGTRYKLLGFGTERVEKALEKIFPEARTVRMDFDTMNKKGMADKIYTGFKNGQYDILIGTQLIAKGWDFAGVDLIGIINSDIGLMNPDFRAAERCYSLMKQVSGRAGRGEHRGKVVLQTFNPANYVISALFEKDYKKFYDKEIEIRKASWYPPFCRLVNIVSSNETEDKALRDIKSCCEYLAGNAKSLKILGPAPAQRYRVAGKYRWQILLKYADCEAQILKDRLRQMCSRRFRSRIKIDVDPQDML
ncbi:MAG: primosomal protein N' [Elusimicrobia bacterium]|nr:primosomal protein N' [Elusimicrobiota bacterium]